MTGEATGQARVKAGSGRGIRKGTRMMRGRTMTRAGAVPGQPWAPLTDPDRIPHREVTRHVCGWCGGPNSHTNRMTNRARVLCHKCMRAEWGGYREYDSWIRSERARNLARVRRAAGRVPS